MNEDSQKLHLKFDGKALEAGRIDAGDFAYTVSAAADLLHFIAKETHIVKNKSLGIDIVALRPGSFEVDLTIKLKDLVEISPAIIPLLANSRAISSAKQLIDILKSLINVKKFLKGESPTKTEIIQKDGSPHVAIHSNNGQISVNINTFNLLQNEGTSRRLHKMVQPLTKEDSELESLQIGEEKAEPVQIKKEEAPYFEKNEELQMTEQRIRGIITAYDVKTCNGKISIGEKRINFEVEIENLKNLDKIIDGLIESMKNKMAIMVIGEAAFDFESNIKKIKIKDIETDPKLL